VLGQRFLSQYSKRAMKRFSNDDSRIRGECHLKQQCRGRVREDVNSL